VRAGHRRAARRAHAAAHGARVRRVEGHDEATLEHLRHIAPLCLRHRLRRNVLDEASSTTRVERALDELYAVA
jgi:hypothetical protein